MVLMTSLALDQGSQTRGPHVVREGLLCSPRCVLGNFK